MTDGTAFAAYDMLAHPERILAVVGGAGLGGFGLGFLIQLLVKAWTRQQLPRWVLTTLRATGAVIAGWLVAMWMFGGGGGGIGGPGGFGFGGGSGGANHKEAEQPPKDDKKNETKEPAEHASGDTLRVEVLGEAPLKALKEKNPLRCYRVETAKGTRLLTLDEVKELIRKRRTDETPLKKVAVVLYTDSPAPKVGLVADLAKWVKDQTVLGTNDALEVDYYEPDRPAPVK